MGIARLKRLVVEDLSRSFTTSELQTIIQEINDKITLHELTGYPVTSTIPRKEAATQILDYFHKTGKLNIFLTLYMDVSQKGFKGEKPTFHNINLVTKEFEECGLKYSAPLKKVINTNAEDNGWGFLEEGKIYNFCFVSVDICANSKLIVSYPEEDVRKTYSLFKQITSNAARKRNGLVWNWEGDGGIIVFHIGDMINQAIFFAIDLLELMPIFNASSSHINGEGIKIRAGIHAGTAEYKNKTDTITSDAIEKVRFVEKKSTLPGSLSVTQSTFTGINRVLRGHFTSAETNNEVVYRYISRFER